MIEIEREMVITRPPEVVFDYLAVVGHFVRWQPAIERAEQVTTGAPGPGTRFRIIIRGPTGPVEVLAEIVEFDRPAGILIRSLTGPAAIRARCELSPHGAGGTATRLRLTASIDLHGFLRFGEGQARMVIDKELPAALDDLAARIASEA